jgi:hypothetical protein
MAAWTWWRKTAESGGELATSQDPGIRTQVCEACESLQELPAVFCERCGAPLIKITKFLLMSFLTVTVVSYLLYGLYIDKLSWPAPLYGYYVFIFVGIGLIVTRRYTVMSVRVFLWSCLLAYATWMLMLSVASVLDYISSDLSDLIRAIETSPGGPTVVFGLVVLELAFAFVVLVRRFRFTLAYRIFATLMAAAAVLLRYVFSYSIGETGVTVSPKLSDWFLWAPETTVKELFELLSVNILRALVAEMAIYSLVKSYGSAMDKYNQVIGKMIGETGTPQAGFVGAATQVTRAIIRTGIYLEQFLLMFLHVFGNYLWGLYRVIRRVVVDLVTPLLTLAMTAFLLGLMAEHTAAYLSGRLNPKLIWVGPWRSPLLMMALCIVAVYGIQVVFLRSVTKFSYRAIWRCNTLLLLWIAPFFFAFFVLVSISLVVTGGVLKRWGHEGFPYHLGPLTGAALVGTVIMMALAIIHSRRAARKAGAIHPAAPGGAAEPTETAVSESPVLEPEGPVTDGETSSPGEKTETGDNPV